MARDESLGWRGETIALIDLSSLTPTPELNLYLNAFVTHGLGDRPRVTGARGALAWQSDTRWLLFVEGLAASDGTRACNTGFRFWPLTEDFGIDVVASRVKGYGKTFGIGFGRYGLRLF